VPDFYPESAGKIAPHLWQCQFRLNFPRMCRPQKITGRAVGGVHEDAYDKNC
jgi:hypothetical protein